MARNKREDSMPILNDIAFSINKDEVLKALQFQSRTVRIDTVIEAHIDEQIEQAYILAEPRAVYETFPACYRDDGYVLDSVGYRLISKHLLRHLKKIEMVSVFACTVGVDIDDRIKQYLSEKALTQATILDAVASVAVEVVADQINEIIRRDAHLQKYSLRRRYSPGFGDWGLEEQGKILQIINAECIDISLTEAYVMMPEKSVSALIGWYQ